MRIISGIYKIVNLKNGKFYVGSSKNIIRRFYIHKSALKNKRHHCIYLQRSWNKHGEQAFIFEILKELDHPSEEQLFAEELDHITRLLPQYNVGSVGGGDNLTNNPNRDDIIKRITATVRDRVAKMSAEERKKIWSHPGDKNPNWRGGISTYYCIDCKRKISYGHKRCMSCSKIGVNNSFYGKHHTADTIEYLKKISTGRRLSFETILKCKQASIDFYNSNDGKKHREEWSKKISGENHPLYGIGHTEESKLKMSKRKKENIKNMTIPQRYFWNKRRKVRVVRIKTDYYFSLQDAMKYYDKSEMSLRFRCESVDVKWNDYEFITITDFNEYQDEQMIKNITTTCQTASGADNTGPLL